VVIGVDGAVERSTRASTELFVLGFVPFEIGVGAAATPLRGGFDGTLFLFMFFRGNEGADELAMN
jgi:hypothetical protein